MPWIFLIMFFTGIVVLLTITLLIPSIFVRVVPANPEDKISDIVKSDEMPIMLHADYFADTLPFVNQPLSPESAVVLVHLGDSLPDHIFECIDQLLDMGTEEVYFIVDHENTRQRLLLTPQVRPVMYSHSNEGSNHFFALRWFMHTFNMKRCIYLEHDNLIYTPISFVEHVLLTHVGERIAVPSDTGNVMLIGSLSALEAYCNFIELEQQPLSKFQIQSPQFCVNLPVIPQSTQMECVFDAASDSAEPTPVVWSVNPQGKKVPFIRFNTPYEYVRLCNLHIPSKRLHLYRSSSWMHPDDIIQGHKFRDFATRSLATEGEVIAFSGEVHTETMIVFVKTDWLPLFFRTVWPKMQGRLVLISHNSDYCVTAEYLPYLNDDRLIRWYAQNVEVTHPKLIGIPIGVANSEWEHGNIDILLQVMAISKARPVENKMYVNLSDTHALRRRLAEFFRHHIDDKSVAVETSDRLKYEDFLRKCTTYAYICAPRGNGPDTHRFWEALYLNIVPVTYEDPFTLQWSVPNLHFPQVEPFRPLAEAPLYDLRQMGVGRLFLRMSYWRHLIAKDAQLPG